MGRRPGLGGTVEFLCILLKTTTTNDTVASIRYGNERREDIVRDHNTHQARGHEDVLPSNLVECRVLDPGVVNCITRVRLVLELVLDHKLCVHIARYRA